MQRSVDRISDPQLRSKVQSAATAVQLPDWPDGNRAAPNDIVRSAIFTVRNRNVRRNYLETEDIAVIGNCKITYTGSELRQDDQDVWLHLLHHARQVCVYRDVSDTAPATIQFCARQFLIALGWGTTGFYYKKLEKTLQRLQATTVSLTSGNHTYNMSLIAKSITGTGRRHQWRVWLDPDLVVLFSGNKYTLTCWNIRKKLTPLAKWLLGYINSHREPYPVRIDTLQRATGASGVTARSTCYFRRNLKKSLDLLVQKKIISDWRLEKNKLFVTRYVR